jgi:glucose-1-phosphatase
MPIKFLYFDLGIVLVNFSLDQMIRQMAAVSGISREGVQSVLFDGNLQREYEQGSISTREFYERFRRETGSTAPLEDLLCAANEIFTPNVSMISVAAWLQQAGWPTGILSNTCECHWQYCMNKYAALTSCFRVHITSYQIGAAKPDAKIFHAAAERAGYAPEEIFFVDDIAGHVAGAKAVGFDAVQYTTTGKFVEDLRKRGLKFNY